MIIRKLYQFEGAHIVRNCTSKQCRENIHGHSYTVEVFLHSDKLDKGYMVMDFALLKKVAAFIHSFDHSYSLWEGEKQDIKDFIYKVNRRVAEIPVSPSAEGYALMILFVADKIISNTNFKNEEGNVKVNSVRVHETKTGYAEAFREDLQLVNFDLDDILFTEGVKEEWKESTWWDKLKQGIRFENPKV